MELNVPEWSHHKLIKGSDGNKYSKSDKSLTLRELRESGVSAKEIRKELKCHVAALPVPYRTTEQNPTFFNLPDNNGCNCPSPHGRTFPTALDPLQCNRYEIGNFAKEVFDLGVKYIGVCCGASPMHIREVAEAIGLRVPASRFRENMSNHFMYGNNKRIPRHMKEYGKVA